MSATNRFHQVANDALVMISENLQPGAKLALVIYTAGKPELDIVLKDSGLEVDEAVNTLRRRGGLSLDGDNAYKRGIWVRQACCWGTPKRESRSVFIAVLGLSRSPRNRKVLGLHLNSFGTIEIFLRTKKNPADVNLRGFRRVEAEVGIEPA